MAAKFSMLHYHAESDTDLAVSISEVKDQGAGRYRTVHIGPNWAEGITFFLPETSTLPWLQQVDSAVRAVMFELFPPDENGDQ